MDNWKKCPILRRHADALDYSAIPSVCEKRVQWEAALRLLERMPQSSLATDVAATSACEEGCCFQQLMRTTRDDINQTEVLVALRPLQC